ncbi:MAG: hypothetical protein JJT96_02330 [Opitutales bacterium]|nr:hypothetical protein [Opitutales bacterium]
METRVDRIEEMIAELAHAQLRTEISLRTLSKEMREFKEEMRVFKEEMRVFKDEMTAFKDESERDRKRMNKAWGDLANKLGSIAEDIVAPNVTRLADEVFGMGENVDLMVRGRRSSRRGEARVREFDIVCAGLGKVLVVEVKSSPTIEAAQAFPSKLESFFDFYPEYEGHELIGIVASWSLPEEVRVAASGCGLYGMAMGDETMDIVARPA